MKIVCFAVGRRVRYGVWRDDESVEALSGTPFRAIKPTGEVYRMKEVKLLAPCLPSKIVALGLNYRPHATEMSQPIPEAPLIFLKPPSAVIGPEDNIIYPHSSTRVDYEGELAVVIGKTARQVSVRDSLSYVLGYTCFNDVTARDLQSQDGQWTRAKGFDTFAAIGPCIETDLDPKNVAVETYLNGERRQRGHTRDLVFPAPELVSFISHVMTLLPGDVIATGTPGGIGPMKPGDTVEVRIEQVGVLRNYVVKG